MKDWIREFREAYEENLSYVRVMPETNPNPIERATELGVDDIYLLKTKGYVRDEQSEAEEEQKNPPPATPNANRQTAHLYSAGPELNQVQKDRLNSSERFTNFIRQKALQSQDELNQKLETAEKKAGKKAVRALTPDDYIQQVAKWMGRGLSK